MTRHQWVEAAALHPGDHLRTPASSAATVIGGLAPAETTGWMWDLTIPGDHDFYVNAVTQSPTVDAVHNHHTELGTTSVLVHNCGFTDEQMQEAIDYATSENKLAHVIDPPKHRFGTLVQAAGGRAEAMIMIVQSLSDGAGLPASGPFQVTRVINGEAVTIRGAVVNGVPKIGTAFIPRK